jgi:guanylate kinase
MKVDAPLRDTRRVTTGRLIVISGPSGAGKTSLCDELLKMPGFCRVVTSTTRPPRKGEERDVDYHFLSRDEFERGIARGAFLEHAEVHGHLYGTPRGDIEAAIRRGHAVLLNIDVQGARTLMEARDRGEISGMMTVFVMPPDAGELERRLRRRDTESAEELRRRLAVAQREMEARTAYDHVVVNDDLSRAAREVAGVAREPQRAR